MSSPLYAELLFQALSEAEVVRDETCRLPVPGPVHARDGLEQLDLADGAVEVHHAFDGRVGGCALDRRH